MKLPSLSLLEKKASDAGFILRIKVNRPLNIWSFKVVVAKKIEKEKIKIYGEMKGWAYRGKKGLQLDTMRTLKSSPAQVGHLVWSATMAWALETTPCTSARLLAIYDDEFQHRRLVRYFLMRKFHTVKQVKSSFFDLPLRMVWGGSGCLMIGDCNEVYEYSFRNYEKFLGNH